MNIIQQKILLGSASPRRKLLLEELGARFRVKVSHTDEIPLPHLVRDEIALYISEEKADALRNELQDDEILITADTIVWLENKMLGKPFTEKEAIEMLQALNGRKHQVYTGVCIMNKKKKESFCVRSDVTFKKLNKTEIEGYVSAYSPFDKAGAYGAQECLPEGMNPCSEKEKIFLKENGREEMCKNANTAIQTKRIPLINSIAGSYFNVMGLPVVELVTALSAF